MSNSPILKLQEMASSGTTDISELLSKAKMISVKLGLNDISEWIEFELNGYPSNGTLPEYRILKDVPIRAFNPYQGWIPCQMNGIQNYDMDIYKWLTTVFIPNPISMIIQYAKSDKIQYGDLYSEMSAAMQDITKTDFRMAWCFNQAQMINILSNVKSKILDWALLLESKNIYGEGLRFSLEEKNEATAMTINNTNNFHGSVNNAGTIGAGNAGNINQKNTINVGDFKSLEKQLREYGIADNDISELRTIIDASPRPTSSSNLGNHIGGWLGSMIGKAYSGSLKVIGSAAPILLTNAICHYYGIPV